jgi:hypothetical protein
MCAFMPVFCFSQIERYDILESEIPGMPDPSLYDKSVIISASGRRMAAQ